MVFDFVCLAFQDRVSLCSPGCLRTHSVDQARFELKDLLSLPQECWRRGWGFSSVVECLPRKCKALGSVPSSEKKNQKKKKRVLEELSSFLKINLELFLFSFLLSLFSSFLLPACIATCFPGAEDQNGASDLLELELRMVVSYKVGPEIWTWPLFKSSKSS